MGLRTALGQACAGKRTRRRFRRRSRIDPSRSSSQPAYTRAQDKQRWISLGLSANWPSRSNNIQPAASVSVRQRPSASSGDGVRKAICRLRWFFPGLRVSESRHRLSGCLRLRSPLPPWNPPGARSSLIRLCASYYVQAIASQDDERRGRRKGEIRSWLPGCLGCCLCPMQYRASPELAAMCNSSVQKLEGTSLLFPLDSGLSCLVPAGVGCCISLWLL